MTDRKTIFVKDVMQDHFLLVDGLKTVRDALDAMVAEKARALIVQKRSSHDEFGIVLLSDIAKKVLARDKAPERVNVYEIMSKPVIHVSPDMDVRYCARLFDSFGLSLAPVIDGATIVGVVTYEGLVFDGLLNIYS